MTDKLLTTRESAARLRVPARAIHKLVDIGALPGNRRGLRRYSMADLDEAEAHLSRLCFVATVSPDSWERLLADGLRYTLLGRHYEVMASIMRPGGRLIFYVTGRYEYRAAAELIERPRRKNTVWPKGVFAFVLPLRPLKIANSGGVPADGLVHDLAFIRRPERWGQYLRGAIRMVSKTDYDTIYGQLAGLAER